MSSEVGSYTSTKKRLQESKRLWSEDSYNTAKFVFRWFGGFFNEVTNDIGLERTQEMMIKQFEQFIQDGATQIKTLRENNELDLNTLAAQTEALWLMGGFESKVEATPTSIITTTKKCPFYDGFIEAGVDHSTIEAYCRGKDNAGDAQYKQQLGSHAGLKMLRYRTGSDDYCIEEEIILKQ
jgi:hypothetical protein